MGDDDLMFIFDESSCIMGVMLDASREDPLAFSYPANNSTLFAEVENRLRSGSPSRMIACQTSDLESELYRKLLDAKLALAKRMESQFVATSWSARLEPPKNDPSYRQLERGKKRFYR